MMVKKSEGVWASASSGETTTGAKKNQASRLPHGAIFSSLYHCGYVRSFSLHTQG